MKANNEVVNVTNTSVAKGVDKKLVAFIIVFSIACLCFIAYTLLFVLFCSTVFGKSAESLEDALGEIFGLLFLIIPVFISCLLSVGFSIGSSFCKKKWIRIPSIIIAASSALSLTITFIILFTR